MFPSPPLPPKKNTTLLSKNDSSRPGVYDTGFMRELFSKVNHVDM